MTDDLLSTLRDDAKHLFWHGFDNYMNHAFPEDELKPISCQPQTRNRDDPTDIGLNDVLGNYSVTLIDSLSTLAILASDDNPKHARQALTGFQNGVRALVELYGDGTEGGRCGKRACGFDLDSKVQVFETTIRGVGGLLSAHLFAIGELPITGYTPAWTTDKHGNATIPWPAGFRYSNQLLALAHDLASRLLPAFTTPTGLPYPRVNLRHGIPFYRDAEEGVCRLDGTSSNPRDITETCSAGAGSLVLEFSTLSRLTGDTRFEHLAKTAFWAVWNRRSAVGLIGGGIDAESGQWTMPPLAGIGAGIDSFFEYALKSSILLSGLPFDTNNTALHGPSSFLQAWTEAHSSIKRHVYRSSGIEKHPYYAPTDLLTGAPRYTWIDNLSAYYPGLLVLAGELEEAIESHLLYAALWTRYSALPERWMAHNSFIDPSFKHWAGRPEFIESTYYLYQATRDPWYLHVGEMALRDIRRRCWTKCGWADLGDVTSGEQRDRMESFFLGETAKYLYLLFTPGHPLNRGDRPVVFTTEGHPLVIPDALRQASSSDGITLHSDAVAPTCPSPSPPLPLTVSNVANRADLFHAAALAQLHLVPVTATRSSPLLETSPHSPGISLADVRSPTNYTFYPWTLPANLIPPGGVSSAMQEAKISTLTFPNLSPADDVVAAKGLVPLGALRKVAEGVVVSSLSNVRLSMVQHGGGGSGGVAGVEGFVVGAGAGAEYRIQGIANWALGRDEKVLISGEALRGVAVGDERFRRDLEGVFAHLLAAASPGYSGMARPTAAPAAPAAASSAAGSSAATPKQQQQQQQQETQQPQGQPQQKFTRHLIPAILPTGPGAAPLPSFFYPTIDPSNVDPEADPLTLPPGSLSHPTIFYLDSTLCSHRLPAAITKNYNILVIKRGECSFGDKLANIPSSAPSATGLQLVVILSVPEALTEGERAGREGGDGDGDGGGNGSGSGLIRPLLEHVQKTRSGFERRWPLGMVMVEGSEGNVRVFRAAAAAVGVVDVGGGVDVVAPKTGREREMGEVADSWGDAGGKGGEGGEELRAGFAVKRRYWFESMGVPIGNLIML
ncbi:glycoside hydrolase family 47 protein [Baudoinia panamericana UAMH 10762]|uniref:alpha-1,2-Mannosidase n=1 Tax=Baudoinia panamericana (strain UAMH 10762) TaxID=717646 RepID=M2N6Q3_BAUPA|nr:glycoside hydrolase family 47 protein [Baudoinia panamericana UAMH 10762]EMC99768.1 glycoside hydrolase family 47 protein [Baudoinia panamericana UAMH 10762]